ncbi:MAG: hypothetical protein KGJ23_14495 [Euryarchaeota archaeon]|nr:hypothetical protein [Euryarchaeota archaeon]MDE1880354.1 hypothetical protein [Euryarchaeota archaeon]MDE2046193.1 hypothetical protein [Thermoplasmata archaeon]
MPRIRYTSGGKEGELLSRAKALRKDPMVLLPRLSKDCPTGPFDRIRRDLEAVQEAKQDAEELKHLSGKGESLARAYAGLLYYAEERPSVVSQVARHPTGDIPFLPLSNGSKEAEIAVQYYDDPRRLLLGYVHMARGGLFGGGGFHFYALERGILCTGKEADPPPEFVRASLEHLPYRLSQVSSKEGGTAARGDGTQGTLVCQHLARGEAELHLIVRWTSVARTLKVCERCVKPDAHLLASLSESMAIPHPEGEFEVSARLPIEHVHEGRCPLGDLPTLPGALEKRYRAGRLSDAELLRSYNDEIERSEEGVRSTVLVAGGRCYEREVENFLGALAPTTVERRALAKVLPDLGRPLISPEARAGKVVELLWKDHALDLLEAAGASPEEARRREAEARSAPGRAAEVLNRFAQQQREEEAVAKLPTYRALVPEAELADRLARLLRTAGAAEVERRISRESPPEGKVRGMAWAFLLALGKETSQAWRFSDTEKEFGQALAPAARRLLDAPASGYHEALNALLLEAGIPTWGEQT